MILDTAVHAQTTRRHRLETLGHVLHQRVHALRQSWRPGCLVTPSGGVGQLAGMASHANSVVHRFRILCSLSAVKRDQGTKSEQPSGHTSTFSGFESVLRSNAQ